MASLKLTRTQCSRIRSQAKPGRYIVNPITGRRVYATSAAGKALVRTCRAAPSRKSPSRKSGKTRKHVNKPTYKAPKTDRPSPSESATLYPEGKRMVGNDGGVWVIKVSKNGVHRWVRS